MKETFAKLSPFHVDPERVKISFEPDDFEKASVDEKSAMVEKRKSVSYWRDAWRRFRKNTVSMVSLFIFILVLFFAFIGPYLIPYNYSNQYRSSQKLAPGKFSEQETLIKSIEGKVQYMYATALQPGSITALSSGQYYMYFKGKAWCFTLDKTTGDTVIAVLNGNLVTIRERDIKDGEIPQFGLNRPKLFRHKIRNGLIPVGDYFYRHRLHSPGTQPFTNLSHSK